jgi:hypothetical protein
MDIIDIMIRNLADGPLLLKELLAGIPNDCFKVRRIPDKWSIHEHTCHLSEVESMMYDRLLTFKNATYPAFQPFLPGTNANDEHLLEMDLNEALEHYTNQRFETIQLARSLAKEDWQKEASHPEYEHYTAKILLRHVLMHDHLHFYRIEQLWLTREAFLLG